ncbi:MAG: hypothetical protein IOC38_12110, partial [Burkholderia sp.]
ITAAYADQETAGLLASDGADCSMADMLIRARRWWTDGDGCIVHAGLYLYRADRFVLDITHDLDGNDRSADLIPSPRAAARKTARKSTA